MLGILTIVMQMWKTFTSKKNSFYIKNNLLWRALTFGSLKCLISTLNKAYHTSVTAQCIIIIWCIINTWCLVRAPSLFLILPSIKCCRIQDHDSGLVPFMDYNPWEGDVYKDLALFPELLCQAFLASL